MNNLSKMFLVGAVLLVLVFVVFILQNQELQNKLVSPGFSLSGSSTKIPSPSPEVISSPNAPKSYQFDRGTDLKEELNKVNPQVLDSDFE
jgi:hypothetical protein